MKYISEVFKVTFCYHAVCLSTSYSIDADRFHAGSGKIPQYSRQFRAQVSFCPRAIFCPG